MISNKQFLAAASAIALSVGMASPAFAAGTTAGTDIVNNVSVNYQVGGVDQTEETASDTFEVDRVINLTVARLDDTATSVSPGQTRDNGTPGDTSDDNPPVTTFTVTNTSNEVLDFALTVANQSGGAAAISGTDNFEVSSLEIYVDSNGNGVYDPGVDTDTFIDELAEDTGVDVFVIGDIPINEVTGNIATVTLTATAREGNGGTTGGAVGAAITQDTGADTDGVETVFADAAGDTDGARDGAFSASDDYVVAAADISVVKTSTVLWDPVNGSSNPKAIPGAVVEYCIAVSNASGGAAATNVAISDDIGAVGNISFYATAPSSGPATIPDANGVRSALACDGTGANADASGLGESGGVVSGNLGTVSAGGTETLLFRVTVDN